MVKVGSRVKIISVPKYAQDDLYKEGTVKKLYDSSDGQLTADILLDGDEGTSVCYVWQLAEI